MKGSQGDGEGTGKPAPYGDEKSGASGMPHPTEAGVAWSGCKRPTKSKYGNRKTVADGKRFDSKHEAEVYGELRLRCLAGEYMGLACQVPFYLPGGVKYIADFVVFPPEGGYVVMDAKSEATRKDKTYRLKRRLMKECLHIDIQEV